MIFIPCGKIFPLCLEFLCIIYFIYLFPGSLNSAWTLHAVSDSLSHSRWILPSSPTFCFRRHSSIQHRAFCPPPDNGVIIIASIGGQSCTSTDWLSAPFTASLLLGIQ
uniref:Secreted protein n=1 Tax=Pyxicephalus adspersus TaxID=30357 RepID=A0AAV3ALN1_PYXAD|nr:TPA: hypothetical protein GDO54_011610 [Pyxicephalus adspersus]